MYPVQAMATAGFFIVRQELLTMNKQLPNVGDVLISHDDIGEIDAGLYVVIKVGVSVTISRLGKDEAEEVKLVSGISETLV